jgi:hypothetical protein
MIVETYRAEHMLQLDLQEGQMYLGQFLTPQHAKALEGENAFAGVHEGRVLIVAGLFDWWKNRACVWAYLDKDAGQHIVAIHRAVSRFLDLYIGVRIEASVDCDFEPGHRWAQMLGFKLETPRMVAYRPDGGDCAMYVRIQK